MPTTRNQSTSHKRTNSAAGNTTTAPEIKRRVGESSEASLQGPVPNKSAPHVVYVVTIDMADPYLDATSEIEGIYASLKDANNAVRRNANDFSCEDGDTTHGVKGDGRVYWSSDDVGEGARAELSISVMKVKPQGSEPECEFENSGKANLEGKSGKGDGSAEEEEEEGEDYY